MPGPFDLPQMPGATGSIMDLMNPERQRLWDAMGGLGTALLQAGAPSPYPNGFGGILGQGLAGANAALQGGEDRSLKRALTAAQVATAQSRVQRDQDWSKLIKGDGTAPAAGGIPQPGYQREVSPGGVQGGPNAFNIGNVRPVGGGPDSGFQQVPDFNSGVMLAVNNAKAYPAAFNQGQPMTLLQIGERWAPKGDGKNDPARWAQNVAAISGLPVNQPLDLNNPQTAAQFARGVHGAEWGGQSVRPVEEYARALTSGVMPAGGAAPPNAQGQGDGLQPVQYTPQQPKTLQQVVQGLPPGVRQIIGVMGPEAGIKELLKYADPDATPAIDARTGQIVFAPKHLLNSGQYQPIEGARLQMDERRNQVEEANKDVVLDANGKPRINQPLIDTKKAISAAQGTDAEGKMLLGDYEDVRKANTEMQGNALVARTNISQTNRLSQLLDQVNTGRFTGTTQDIKQMAKGLGINLDALGVRDDTAPAQAAQALTGQLALALRNPSQGAGMPGAMSDADRKFLAAMVPGLETTPEGRKLMVDYSLKMYQRQIDLAQIANDFMRSPEAKKDPNKLYQVLRDYADKNPLFSEKDLPAGGFSPAPSGSIAAPPSGFKVLGR